MNNFIRWTLSSIEKDFGALLPDQITAELRYSKARVITSWSDTDSTKLKQDDGHRIKVSYKIIRRTKKFYYL